MGYTTRMRQRWRTATPSTPEISRNAQQMIDMHQLDEKEIEGTGPGGKITVRDVKKRLAVVESSIKDIAQSTSEEEE